MVLHLHAYKVIRALTQQSEPDVGGHQKKLITALDFSREDDIPTVEIL